MSARATSWLAWCLWLLCVSLISFALLFYFLASPTPATDTPPTLTALFRILSLAFPTVGALIASRRPKNPIGWIFCAGGLLYSVIVSATNYAEYAQYASSDLLDSVRYAAWFS